METFYTGKQQSEKLILVCPKIVVEQVANWDDCHRRRKEPRVEIN
jgi:hypothetical protein